MRIQTFGLCCGPVRLSTYGSGAGCAPAVDRLSESHRLRATAAARVSDRRHPLAGAGGTPQECGSRRSCSNLSAACPKAQPMRCAKFGSIDGDGFRIERGTTYQSLPGLYVTADVYVPVSGAGPFPAVILTPGHELTAKLGQYNWGANLARAGILSLAIDPMGQGERLQHFDAELGESKVGQGTDEHGMAAFSTLLIGDHVGALLHQRRCSRHRLSFRSQRRGPRAHRRVRLLRRETRRRRIWRRWTHASRLRRRRATSPQCRSCFPVRATRRLNNRFRTSSPMASTLAIGSKWRRRFHMPSSPPKTICSHSRERARLI